MVLAILSGCSCLHSSNQFASENIQFTDKVLIHLAPACNVDGKLNCDRFDAVVDAKMPIASTLDLTLRSDCVTRVVLSKEAPSQDWRYEGVVACTGYEPNVVHTILLNHRDSVYARSNFKYIRTSDNSCLDGG